MRILGRFQQKTIPTPATRPTDPHDPETTNTLLRDLPVSALSMYLHANDELEKELRENIRRKKAQERDPERDPAQQDHHAPDLQANAA